MSAGGIHAITNEGHFRANGNGLLANQATGLLNMVDVMLPMDGRTCTSCGETKAAQEFYLDKRRIGKGRGALKAVCRKCAPAKTKQYREENGDAIRASERASWRRRFHANGHSKRVCSLDWRLKNRFGMTIAEFMAVLEEQNNQCAICKQALEPVSEGRGRHTSACVDHDHATGKVRGLLCNPCNLAVGYLKDDPDRALALSTYLRKQR